MTRNEAEKEEEAERAAYQKELAVRQAEKSRIYQEFTDIASEIPIKGVPLDRKFPVKGILAFSKALGAVVPIASSSWKVFVFDTGRKILRFAFNKNSEFWEIEIDAKKWEGTYSYRNEDYAGDEAYGWKCD